MPSGRCTSAREPHILVRPESKLWTGPYLNFVHAFLDWRKRGSDKDNWFIARPHEYRVAMSGGNGWLHYGGPTTRLRKRGGRKYLKRPGLPWR